MTTATQAICLLLIVALVEGGLYFPSTSSGNNFFYGGDAEFEDANNRIRLIRAQQSRLGAAYFETKQIVDQSFAITFTYSFDWSGVPGDGLALVIQNEAPNALVGGGGALGAAFANIALEVDTYGNEFDPGTTGISIQYGGSPTASNSGSPANSIGSIIPNFDVTPDNQLVTLKLQYDHNLGVFSVFRLIQGDQQLLFYTQPGYMIEDMLNLDQGTAWIGFTASSGYYYAATYIHNLEFTTLQTVPAGVVIICPHDLLVTADSNTCTWSGTTGTPSLINTYQGTTVSYTKQSRRGGYPPGSYTITYTASNSFGYLSASCTQNLVVVPAASCVN